MCGALEAGKNLRLKFENECVKDHTRFNKVLPRRQVCNFAKAGVKSLKKVPKAQKSAESMRDSFVQLLVLVVKDKDVDLDHIMSFPITQCPLSISYPDGEPLTTPKAKMMEILEPLQDTVLNESDMSLCDVYMVDGGNLIHSKLAVTKRLTSYGTLARSMLLTACKQGRKEVHILLDTYSPDALKAKEREKRGEFQSEYVISGPDQVMKESGSRLLKNSKFKDELGRYLIEEWQKPEYADIIGDKSIYVSHGGRCVCIWATEDKEVKTIMPETFQGIHQEADTLLAFHSKQVEGDILVRASDTDVPIILISMVGRHLAEEIAVKYGRIIVDYGIGDSRRLVDISAISTKLESHQKGSSEALPGLHSFTGSDYTAAFFGKGKDKALELMLDSPQYTHAFKNLGQGGQADMKTIEQFLCLLYGRKLKDKSNINSIRSSKLLAMTTCKKTGDKWKHIQKVNCCLLPPCRIVLKEKIRRSQFVAMLWTRADSSNPLENLSPLDYGWVREEEKLIPLWYEGDTLPKTLSDSVEETEDVENVAVEEDVAEG